VFLVLFVVNYNNRTGKFSGKTNRNEPLSDEFENQGGPKPHFFDGLSHAANRHGHA
jgi:hypothetical protein